MFDHARNLQLLTLTLLLLFQIGSVPVLGATPKSERLRIASFTPYDSLRPCPASAVLRLPASLSCQINSCLCRDDLAGSATTIISEIGASSCSEAIGSVDLQEAYSVFDAYCKSYKDEAAGKPPDVEATATGGDSAVTATAGAPGGDGPRVVTATATVVAGTTDNWAAMAGPDGLRAIAAPLLAAIAGGLIL
ncbi:MAG: hypothetical protein M1837_006107 [Sclerophora amabilis]|nr:MAG: hypothetical protein M1837_006107 [Sclerophora amabilis]